MLRTLSLLIMAISLTGCFASAELQQAIHDLRSFETAGAAKYKEECELQGYREFPPNIVQEVIPGEPGYQPDCDDKSDSAKAFCGWGARRPTADSVKSYDANLKPRKMIESRCLNQALANDVNYQQGVSRLKIELERQRELEKTR